MANINKEPSIESLFYQKVYKPKYEIRVRLVITVEKEHIKPKSEHYKKVFAFF